MTEKKKKLTIGEILTAYQASEGFKSDSDFAKALGISRQSLSQWMNDVHKPSILSLRMLGIAHQDTWIERLSNDLLSAMDVDSVHWVTAGDVVRCDGGEGA